MSAAVLNICRSALSVSVSALCVSVACSLCMSTGVSCAIGGFLPRVVPALIFNSTPIAPCAQLRPGHHTPQSINTPSRRPHMRQGSRTRGTPPSPGTGHCGPAGAAARPSSAPHARAPAPLLAGHSGGGGHGGRAGTPRDGGAAGRHVISAAVARVPERDCHGQHQVLPV